MAAGVRVVIVQDLESRMFLTMGSDGDVVFTPYLSKAGRFFEEDEAVETAEAHCPGGFSASAFFEDDESIG